MPVMKDGSATKLSKGVDCTVGHFAVWGKTEGKSSYVLRPNEHCSPVSSSVPQKD